MASLAAAAQMTHYILLICTEHVDAFENNEMILRITKEYGKNTYKFYKKSTSFRCLVKLKSPL